jgi:hypothetical protein
MCGSTKIKNFAGVTQFTVPVCKVVQSPIIANGEGWWSRHTESHLLGSCSLGSGLRSRSLALKKDNAWWGSSVSTAPAGPYRKALARDQEIKGVPAIEGMPADSGPFPRARVAADRQSAIWRWGLQDRARPFFDLERVGNKVMSRVRVSPPKAALYRQHAERLRAIAQQTALAQTKLLLLKAALHLEERAEDEEHRAGNVASYPAPRTREE